MELEQANWDERYRNHDTPWDSGQPSEELRRVLREYEIQPCRVLELGCGTGTNAVFLAQQGFDVTAFDISEKAIRESCQKAELAGVSVEFLVSDLRDLPDLRRSFEFIFDRGVYHCVRKDRMSELMSLLERATVPGGLWLTLAGNANETSASEKGPPRVEAVEICQDLGTLFAIVQLREFHFDGVQIDGEPVRPLAWSVLARRR